MLIESCGFYTDYCPFYYEILNNNRYYAIIKELINEKKIFSIKNNGIESFLSRKIYLKYYFLKNYNNNYENLSTVAYKKIKRDFNNIFATKNIIFDLGGLLADESDLDVAICSYLDKNTAWSNLTWKNYKEYSDYLVSKKDVKWYDYFYQANELGFDNNLIIKLHKENINLVKFFNYSKKFLKLLFKEGHNIFIITGCNSEVLKIRLRLYGLLNYVHGYITSDITKEIGDKYFYYRCFLDKYKVSPDKCLIFSDNYLKDILPANIFGFKTALFFSGGRANTLYNSDGIQPDKLISYSYFLKNKNNSPTFIFDSFRDLYYYYLKTSHNR